MNERVVGIKQSDVCIARVKRMCCTIFSLMLVWIDGWMECMIINALIYVYMCL